jgi:hypothetical protein
MSQWTLSLAYLVSVLPNLWAGVEVVHISKWCHKTSVVLGYLLPIQNYIKNTL